MVLNSAQYKLWLSRSQSCPNFFSTKKNEMSCRLNQEYESKPISALSLNNQRYPSEPTDIKK